jgi:hypothetical protein
MEAMKRTTLSILAAAGMLVLAAPLVAREKLPEKTEDGLVLQKDTKVAAVYLKPGASLEPYDKILLVDAYVAFKKNWQRDYNMDQVSITARIKDSDIERIKKDVANEFRRVFTDELQKGGYEVVTEAAQDVMIVRPAIINLTVNAPDLNTPGMRAMVVTSAGSLTLYAELWDSVTNDKFAQVIDAQEAGGTGFAHRADRVSNKADLDRTLRHWADLLVKALDHAHGKDG